MEIVYTAKFRRDYKKISIDIQLKSEKREALFRADPFLPMLKTHKLQGELSDFWSFSVDYRHRIIFEFQENQSVAIFHAIGDHEVYR